MCLSVADLLILDALGRAGRNICFSIQFYDYRGGASIDQRPPGEVPEPLPQGRRCRHQECLDLVDRTGFALRGRIFGHLEHPDHLHWSAPVLGVAEAVPARYALAAASASMASSLPSRRLTDRSVRFTSTTLEKLPRLMARCVLIPNQRSTWLSQEA
jgi:hypothetical protein